MSEDGLESEAASVRAPPPDASEQPPLLDASDLSLAVSGCVLLSGASFRLRGPRSLILGDSGALWSALTGFPMDYEGALAKARVGEWSSAGEVAKVVRGELTVLGEAVQIGRHHGELALVAKDIPQLPSSVARFLETSARLGLAARGRPMSERAALAAEALSLCQLQGGGRRPLASLTPIERRVVLCAAARAAGSKVILLDHPLAGLDRELSLVVLAAMARLFEGRSTVTRLSSLASEGPSASLVREANDVLVLATGRVEFSGAVSERMREGRLHRLRVRAGEQELVRALGEMGAEVRGSDGLYSLALPQGLGPTDVLVLAASLRAAVVEIAPLM